MTNWLLDNAYRKQERVAKESGVSPGTIRNLMRREPKENVSMAAISKLERYIELQTKQAIVTPSLSETN